MDGKDKIIHKIALSSFPPSSTPYKHHILIYKSNKDIFFLTSQFGGRYTWGRSEDSAFEMDDSNRKLMR
jgi:hypothetical protein